MKTSSTRNRSLAVFLLATFIAGSLSAQRGRSRYGYDNWRYYPTRGQVFVHLPGPSISLQFGGSPFYYSGGLFYRPYGSYYSIAPAPIGIHVNLLPRGYWSLRWGGYPYYYYNGIFYRQSNNAYEVVQAPVGAEVPAIPRDAQPVVIDGEKYYEYNGTYFKDYIKPNGELWYTVEGKHGVLNTDRSTAPPTNQPPADAAASQPAIGDVVDKLPADCRTIVINGKKYFVTPGNLYYEELIDGKQVRYKVAGK